MSDLRQLAEIERMRLQENNQADIVYFPNSSLRSFVDNVDGGVGE